MPRLCLVNHPAPRCRCPSLHQISPKHTPLYPPASLVRPYKRTVEAKIRYAFSFTSLLETAQRDFSLPLATLPSSLRYLSELTNLMAFV